jgi:glycogen synthase
LWPERVAGLVSLASYDVIDIERSAPHPSGIAATRWRLAVDYADRPNSERNGYVFHQIDNMAVESALDRAIDLWYSHPTEFRELMVNGMRQDHSWADPGQHYVDIYQYIAAHKP